MKLYFCKPQLRLTESITELGLAFTILSDKISIPFSGYLKWVVPYYGTVMW